jgi:hypothetical protein
MSHYLERKKLIKGIKQSQTPTKKFQEKKKRFH